MNPTLLDSQPHNLTTSQLLCSSKPSVVFFSAVCSFSRMALTSSVISIATGHHVIHRPQPTQPDVPNWSIHVASLCVSHWRYLDFVEDRMFPP